MPTVNYTISSDFTSLVGDEPYLKELEQEIRAASEAGLVSKFLYTELTPAGSPTTCVVTVSDTLTGAEDTELDSIIAAHEGYVTIPAPPAEPGEPNGPALLDSEGKVPTDQLPDNVGVGAIVEAIVSAERSTTSTSWTDVAGVSVTFTPSAGERVLILAQGVVQSTGSSGQRAEVDVVHNNSGSFVQLGSTRGSLWIESYNAVQDWPWSISRVVELSSAVSTTIKLQFRSSTGTQAVGMLGQLSPIVLQVLRLGV